MLKQKKHDLMEKLDSCYKVVLQSGANGINAVQIAKKLGVHRATVHSYLNTLELMGKVRGEHGLWYAKTEEQGIKPLEKEIIVELPIPKDEWIEISLLEVEAKLLEKQKLPQTAELIRNLLEKLKETRTIRIKGKNVDNLDLGKIQSLIQEAYKRNSEVKSKNLLKYLKGVKNGSL